MWADAFLNGATNVGNFRKYVDSAADRTSISMTSRLRKYAVTNGWNGKVARNTQVAYRPDEGFVVEFADDVREQAMNLEYGTETMRPTAAIRKYENSGHAEEAFIAHLRKEFGGFL